MSIIYKNGHYYGQGGSGGASGGGLFTITVSTQSNNTYTADATPLEVADAIVQDYVLVVNFEMYHTMLNLVSADTSSGQYVFSNEYTEGAPDTTAFLTVALTKSSDMAWQTIDVHTISGIQLRGEITCGEESLTNNTLSLNDFDYEEVEETDVVSPHRLTPSEMADIMSTLPGAPTQYPKYSTTEQVIGEWIDGKPLYQKTIDCGALPNATEKNVAHNINNIALITNIFGVFYSSNSGRSYCIPWTGAGSTTIATMDVDAQNIRIMVSGDRRGNGAYVTLQYTKTTD